MSYKEATNIKEEGGLSCIACYRWLGSTIWSIVTMRDALYKQPERIGDRSIFVYGDVTIAYSGGINNINNYNSLSGIQFHFATYTRDAMHMNSNRIGISAFRYYGDIRGISNQGGLYTIVVSSGTEYINFYIATYTRDAIILMSAMQSTRIFMTYGYFGSGPGNGGSNCIDVYHWLGQTDDARATRIY